MALDPIDNSSQSPRLPIEVCERIIDWVAAAPEFDNLYKLYEDDFALATLRSCSLTCRSWTPRTRLHLFRILRVRCSPNTEGDINGVCSLLANNPALTSFVTTLIARPIPDKPSSLHTISVK